MSKDNGGSAFPWDQPPFKPSPGMTLRDYFAAKALQGILAGMASNVDSWDAEQAHVTARHAYERADAMLAERAK